MPAKNPRINVVFEKPRYNSIKRLARRDGVSLSLKVRDLVKEALEMEGGRLQGSFQNQGKRDMDTRYHS